jgi:hypothetical protein
MANRTIWQIIRLSAIIQKVRATYTGSCDAHYSISRHFDYRIWSLAKNNGWINELYFVLDIFHQWLDLDGFIH